jgi:hypothetical protein
MDMSKALTPWKQYSNGAYSYYRYWFLPHKIISWACEISRWDKWEIIYFDSQRNNHHRVDELYSTIEEVMVAADKVLVSEGYTLLTEEQYERLRVLI